MLQVHYYPHMPIGTLGIYRLLFVFHSFIFFVRRIFGNGSRVISPLVNFGGVAPPPEAKKWKKTLVTHPVDRLHDLAKIL